MIIVSEIETVSFVYIYHHLFLSNTVLLYTKHEYAWTRSEGCDGIIY